MVVGWTSWRVATCGAPSHFSSHRRSDQVLRLSSSILFGRGCMSAAHTRRGLGAQRGAEREKCFGRQLLRPILVG